MIQTFFGAGALETPTAFFMALIVGVFFGWCLERAGFGSSRQLVGLFYLKDMAVLKVMFTAMLTAGLGLIYFRTLGLVDDSQIFFLPTFYGAQAIGGLLFGLGFVMGGWCPGTAVVGVASGRLDAIAYLLGLLGGSVLFNATWRIAKPLATLGSRETLFVWQALKVTPEVFILGACVLAVMLFVLAQFAERARNASREPLFSLPLFAVSAILLTLAAGLTVLRPDAGLTLAGEGGGQAVASAPGARSAAPAATGDNRLAVVQAGEEHIEPEELADRLMAGDESLLVIDVREPEEYAAFRLRGAINVPLAELSATLAPRKNKGTVVLYSGGMVHPAQAADHLAALGHTNVRILTDGLDGFMRRILMPVSLRETPPSSGEAEKVRAWRAFFLGEGRLLENPDGPAPMPEPGIKTPGLVDPAWLKKTIETMSADRPPLLVVDLRGQVEYNQGHIPGAVFLHPESLRGSVNGLSSMLQPSGMLTRHLGLMGVWPSDLVVLVPGERIIDATLAAVALERAGHTRYAILDGGHAGWLAAKGPVNQKLPDPDQSRYPAAAPEDGFTVDAAHVAAAVKDKTALILDVRPREFFTGAKSDEARAGHIPGAINRPFTEDVVAKDGVTRLKSLAELAAEYEKIIPSKSTRIIVHCRTGHQASQTFFVLKRLLGYPNVAYYDAGWSEWAARPYLPVQLGETGGALAKP